MEGNGPSEFSRRRVGRVQKLVYFQMFIVKQPWLSHQF